MFVFEEASLLGNLEKSLQPRTHILSIAHNIFSKIELAAAEMKGAQEEHTCRLIKHFFSRSCLVYLSIDRDRYVNWLCWWLESHHTKKGKKEFRAIRTMFGHLFRAAKQLPLPLDCSENVAFCSPGGRGRLLQPFMSTHLEIVFDSCRFLRSSSRSVSSSYSHMHRLSSSVFLELIDCPAICFHHLRTSHSL